MSFHFHGEPETEPRPIPPADRDAPERTIDAIDWMGLEGREPPEREFLVEDWLPVGVATSLYAPGGYGKSLIAQKLGSCITSGTPFLGLRTVQGPVLAVFCEDDGDELWRRQVRINASAGLSMRQLGSFHAQGRLGMENMLMLFPRGKPAVALPLLAEIEERARETGARLIVLDNAAQVFGGDEIIRAEVTVFLNALNGLARRLNAAVLLLGHPPKNGSEYSGSTAWHSVVRGMWTLSKPLESDEDKDEDQSTRPLILRRHKANYSPADVEIRLRWSSGVLVRDDGEVAASPMEAAFQRHNAKGAFLEALDELTEQGRAVSASRQSATYAPKCMKVAGLAEGFTKRDLERAMQDLFKDRGIRADAKLWQRPNRHWVVGIARAGGSASECADHDAGATTHGAAAEGAVHAH